MNDEQMSEAARVQKSVLRRTMKRDHRRARALGINLTNNACVSEFDVNLYRAHKRSDMPEDCDDDEILEQEPVKSDPDWANMPMRINRQQKPYKLIKHKNVSKSIISLLYALCCINFKYLFFQF